LKHGIGTRQTGGSLSLPARERGLKQDERHLGHYRPHVAPRAGARIETRCQPSLPIFCHGSLPARERGLKLGQVRLVGDRAASLPARERGLKHLTRVSLRAFLLVAPRAGARIETSGS